MAGAICSFSFLHDDMVIAVKAINTDRRDKRWLCVFILLAFVSGEVVIALQFVLFFPAKTVGWVSH